MYIYKQGGMLQYWLRVSGTTLFHVLCNWWMLLVFHFFKTTNEQGSLALPLQKLYIIDSNGCIRSIILSTLAILMLIADWAVVNLHDCLGRSIAREPSLYWIGGRFNYFLGSGEAKNESWWDQDQFGLFLWPNPPFYNIQEEGRWGAVQEMTNLRV